jgi:hypothetical protein
VDFVGIVKPQNLVHHKSICNKRSIDEVSKQQIQMSTNISLSVYPLKLIPTKIYENTVSII